MDSSTRMTVESYIGPGARNGNVLIYAKLNFCLWRRINVAVRNFVSSFEFYSSVLPLALSLAISQFWIWSCEHKKGHDHLRHIDHNVYHQHNCNI